MPYEKAWNCCNKPIWNGNTINLILKAAHNSTVWLNNIVTTSEKHSEKFRQHQSATTQPHTDRRIYTYKYGNSRFQQEQIRLKRATNVWLKSIRERYSRELRWTLKQMTDNDDEQQWNVVSTGCLLLYWAGIEFNLRRHHRRRKSRRRRRNRVWMLGTTVFASCALCFLYVVCTVSLSFSKLSLALSL